MTRKIKTTLNVLGARCAVRFTENAVHVTLPTRLTHQCGYHLAGGQTMAECQRVDDIRKALQAEYPGSMAICVYASPRGMSSFLAFECWQGWDRAIAPLVRLAVSETERCA